MEDVWKKMKARSKRIAKEVIATRRAFENLDKLEKALTRKESKKTMEEEEAEGEEGEEAGKTGEEEMAEGEGEGSGGADIIKPQKKLEPANPYARKVNPRLAQARELADQAANKTIPLDPMPAFVFKMKDNLSDYALMIYRLYGIGYGPLEGKMIFVNSYLSFNTHALKNVCPCQY